MNFEKLNGKSIREAFEEFNCSNPHVYKEFERQALEAINRGRKKISAKMTINWIRWNSFLKTTDKNFKINDAFHSYYARHFMEKNPEHTGVFETRVLRNENKGPYMITENDGQLCFI